MNLLVLPDGFQFSMAIHHAMFDESGKADMEHVIFAGLIANPVRWVNLADRWIELLKPHGLRYWRTTNAAQLNQEYSRFRGHRKELEELTLNLARVICDCVDGGSSQSITMELYKALPDAKRQELKDPFYAAFDSGVTSLFKHHIVAGDTVTLVCDDSEEYSSESLKVYRRLRKLHPVLAAHMVGICFHDDRATPGLQAADLFAFCYRKKAEGKLSDVWQDVMNLFDATFSDQTPGEVRV